MKREQLSSRIGNIDERLIQEAEQWRKPHKKNMQSILRKFSAMAAVLALMVCSGTVGAVAFGAETQETIVLEDIGLTLMLPDDWKGKYDVTLTEYGSYVVYSPQINKACGGNPDEPFTGGTLFSISAIDEAMTAEQFYASEWSMIVPCRYLFTTKDATYILYHVTDVQFTPDTLEEYRALESGVRDIRIIVDGLLVDAE